jgi:hypothetical protein
MASRPGWKGGDEWNRQWNALLPFYLLKSLVIMREVMQKSYKTHI